MPREFNFPEVTYVEPRNGRRGYVINAVVLFTLGVIVALTGGALNVPWLTWVGVGIAAIWGVICLILFFSPGSRR